MTSTPIFRIGWIVVLYLCAGLLLAIALGGMALSIRLMLQGHVGDGLPGLVAGALFASVMWMAFRGIRDLQARWRAFPSVPRAATHRGSNG